MTKDKEIEELKKDLVFAAKRLVQSELKIEALTKKLREERCAHENTKGWMEYYKAYADALL